MKAFCSVNDENIADMILKAQGRLIVVVPGVSVRVADAIAKVLERKQLPKLTLVTDLSEETYQSGYGEPQGLQKIQELMGKGELVPRSSPGLRLGLLVTGNQVVVWSPTPLSIENARDEGEPNGILLEGEAANKLSEAVVPPAEAGKDRLPEIGTSALSKENLQEVVKKLAKNPPAPFDLSRRTRVFSTRFQYVEFEVRGAVWAEREIRLSSILLNADVPEEMEDLLETKIKPYALQANISVKVPAVIEGQIAYNEKREKILVAVTQADLEKRWNELRRRFIKKLPNFGWLIRRAEKVDFEKAVRVHEEVLCCWVHGFRETIEKDDKGLVDRLTSVIEQRVKQSPKDKSGKPSLTREQIRHAVEEGIERIRIVEPSVKIIFKDIAWESSRDEEFIAALEKALPEKDREKWFEEFDAVRKKRGKEIAL